MLATLSGNTENILAYVRNSGFSEEKYLALIPEMKLCQQLFQLKYREDITDQDILKKLLKLESNIELSKRLEILDSWLASNLGGVVSVDQLDLVCPECLCETLTDKADDGDKVCMACGLVVDASYDEGVSFDDSLDRDVTFQPSSALSFTDGLGCTLKSTDIHRLLINNDVDFSEFKKTNPHEASDILLNGLVVKDGFAFRLSQGYVRRLPLADIDNVFNQLDKPLRKYKMSMIVDSFSNDNKGVLSYTSFVCDKYGISDLKFRDTLARKVRSARKTLKYFGNSRPRIKPLVDTMFYLTLLRFKKRTEILKAKPNLQIDYSIANLIAEHADFKQKHSKPNLDSSFLDAYEVKVLKQ